MTDRPRIAHVAAAVLAGGQGKRMGRDKARLELAGRALVARAVERAAAVFEQVFICGPPELGSLGYPVVADEFPGAGPISGIVSVMRVASAPWIFVLPCDSPFVGEDFLRGMASLARDQDVVVARCRGLYEPLHALYSRRLLPRFEQMVSQGENKVIVVYQGAKLMEPAPELLRQWDPKGVAFFNVNTPDDLARAEDYLAGRRPTPWK